MIKSYLKSSYMAVALLFLALSPAQADDFVTIKQISSGRFLGAQLDGDFAVVTSDWGGGGGLSRRNLTWKMIPYKGAYQFQHMETRRFLDAHEIAEMDFHLVTRPRKFVDHSQFWQVVAKGNGSFTIMQMSSGRFMDAHEVPALNYGVVSRPRQDNATQLWVITKIPNVN